LLWQILDIKMPRSHGCKPKDVFRLNRHIRDSNIGTELVLACVTMEEQVESLVA
jgi:hypothetical protein